MPNHGYCKNCGKLVNNMIKWFKERVLGIKPIFKIKIEKAWFSEKYFCIKFSNNNGWSWRYIIDVKYDINSPCSELTTDIAYWGPDSIETIAKDFDSFEKCLAYNKRVLDNIEKTNVSRRKTYEKSLKNANNFIDNFNKANDGHSR